MTGAILRIARDNPALAVFFVIFLVLLVAFIAGNLSYYQFGQLVAALMVLGIMSFLLKENSFYRFLEHLMIGVAGGIWLFKTWHTSLRPGWWIPLNEGLAGAQTIGPVLINLLLPLVGLLWYFTFSRKYVWLSRIVIGLFMGVAAGYTVSVEFYKQIGQLRAMAAPLFGPRLYPMEIFTNIFMWFLVLIVMYYFFFTFRRAGRLQGGLARWGRICMMIGFGALFGNTVQGRLAWLIDRFVFLVDRVLLEVILPVLGF